MQSNNRLVFRYDEQILFPVCCQQGNDLNPSKFVQDRFSSIFVDMISKAQMPRKKCFGLSFVVSNCEFVTFQLVSWVRCGT